MAGPYIAGTFATGGGAHPGGTPSDVCVINFGRSSMRLTLVGASAQNTVKTQKRTAPGGAWVDQTTYNADQTNTAIPVAPGEEWRLMTVALQPVREIRYVLAAQ